MYVFNQNFDNCCSIKLQEVSLTFSQFKSDWIFLKNGNCLVNHSFPQSKFFHNVLKKWNEHKLHNISTLDPRLVHVTNRQRRVKEKRNEKMVGSSYDDLQLVDFSGRYIRSISRESACNEEMNLIERVSAARALNRFYYS